MKIRLHKTPKNNYRGQTGKHRLFAHRMAHGGWYCDITNLKFSFPFNGRHTSSMPTLNDVKKWIRRTLENEIAARSSH